MKKINIKTKLEKYKINNLNKKNLLLTILLTLNLAVIIWCVIELVNLTIYTLIVSTVIINSLVIVFYNIYSKSKIRVDCINYTIINKKPFCKDLEKELINQCISCKKFVNKPFLE